MIWCIAKTWTLQSLISCTNLLNFNAGKHSMAQVITSLVIPRGVVKYDIYPSRITHIPRGQRPSRMCVGELDIYPVHGIWVWNMAATLKFDDWIGHMGSHSTEIGAFDWLRPSHHRISVYSCVCLICPPGDGKETYPLSLDPSSLCMLYPCETGRIFWQQSW